ncbi:hypothetical protein NG99_21060 [Erwinia typographi]|uniref:Fimbrial-type adhesion domain-containing protein n=1 Tax=Erwinia typographi TaxID=371042 RepID=A0A0A3ZSU8_9GAMM|nr:fimbrial protein [Erwinia typographi]KGT88758.1 hypothetical protein NG99_21060 [Erwinia typographi]
MKKLIIASMVSALMTGALSVPSYAADPTPETTPVIVDGGKINFTGTVVAAPCAVDIPADGQNVELGQVTTSALATKGAVSSSKDFSIKLVGCDLSHDATDPTKAANYTSASIIFDGDTLADDNTTLSLKADSAGETTAQNVGIQIQSNNKVVAIDGSTVAATQALSADGDYEIPFTANYVATAAGVVAGHANSTATFKVSYE